jgi:hypothetical protein
MTHKHLYDMKVRCNIKVREVYVHINVRLLEAETFPWDWRTAKLFSLLFLLRVINSNFIVHKRTLKLC